MTPEWVKQLAFEWGHQMRKFHSKATSIQGTMARIREEGPVAAAIRGKSDYTPYIADFPEEVGAFHRAWCNLDHQDRHVLWIDYVERLSLKDKLSETGLKRGTYYAIRAKAMEHIGTHFHLYA